MATRAKAPYPERLERGIETTPDENGSINLTPFDDGEVLMQLIERGRKNQIKQARIDQLAKEFEKQLAMSSASGEEPTKLLQLYNALNVVGGSLLDFSRDRFTDNQTKMVLYTNDGKKRLTDTSEQTIQLLASIGWALEEGKAIKAGFFEYNRYWNRDGDNTNKPTFINYRAWAEKVIDEHERLTRVARRFEKYVKPKQEREEERAQERAKAPYPDLTPFLGNAPPEQKEPEKETPPSSHFSLALGVLAAGVLLKGLDNRLGNRANKRTKRLPKPNVEHVEAITETTRKGTR